MARAEENSAPERLAAASPRRASRPKLSRPALLGNAESDTVRAITVRYLFALALLALLALGAYRLLQETIRTQQASANAIKLSGRQSVIAQRLALTTIELMSAHEPAVVARLKQDLSRSADTMERTHEGLLQGDPELDLSGASAEVQRIYFEPPVQLDRQVRECLRVARSLAASPKLQFDAYDPDFELMLSPALLPDLCDALEALQARLEAENDENILHLRRRETMVFGTTLFVLLTMGLLVFRPMVARVKGEMGKLQEAEAFTRAIVDTASDGILTFDQDGSVASFNPMAERLFGLPAVRAIGRDVGEFVRLEGPGLLQSVAERARASGPQLEGRTAEVVGCRPDGTFFPIHLSLARTDLGGRRMFVAIARDVSDLKRTQEELKARATELVRSNTELEQFAYVASHDLQEPLRMISSYTQLLAKRYGALLDQNGREFIDFIVDGSTRMQRLIQDLLALSRGASLIVSGDTGPLHVAGAAGTPAIAIFGPTDPARNGPWSDGDVTISRFHTCRCHYERRCHEPRWCLADVAVAEITAAIQQRLATGGA